MVASNHAKFGNERRRTNRPGDDCSDRSPRPLGAARRRDRLHRVGRTFVHQRAMSSTSSAARAANCLCQGADRFGRAGQLGCLRHHPDRRRRSDRHEFVTRLPTRQTRKALAPGVEGRKISLDIEAGLLPNARRRQRVRTCRWFRPARTKSPDCDIRCPLTSSTGTSPIVLVPARQSGSRVWPPATSTPIGSQSRSAQFRLSASL
jgi:hypothetical protein